MGHFIFIVLHLIGIMTGLWMLVVTVPAHLIYAAVKGNKPKVSAQPDAATHTSCPHCAEPILRAAKVCKHCGGKVDPACVADQPKVKCRSCGSLNDSSRTLCEGCGLMM